MADTFSKKQKQVTENAQEWREQGVKEHSWLMR